MADDSLWTTLNTELWLLYPATALWGNSWGMISYITCRWSRSKLFWWSPWCQTILRFRTRSSSTCLCHTLLFGSFAYNIAHTWYSVGGEIKLLSLISILLFPSSVKADRNTLHQHRDYACDTLLSHSPFSPLPRASFSWWYCLIFSDVYAQNKSYRTQ